MYKTGGGKLETTYNEHYYRNHRIVHACVVIVLLHMCCHFCMFARILNVCSLPGKNGIADWLIKIKSNKPKIK